MQHFWIIQRWFLTRSVRHTPVSQCALLRFLQELDFFSPAFYGVIRKGLAGRLDADLMAEMASRIETVIETNKIRDWVENHDVLNAMRNAIKDYLFEVESAQQMRFSNVELDEIMEIFTERVKAWFPHFERLGVAQPAV